MNQEIRKKLDRITNSLFSGGVVNPITYIEQISYLIYLKLLDEEENNRILKSQLSGGNGKSLFPDQAQRYRWSKWRFLSGQELRNFVRDEVFNYLANGLVKEEPQIAEYFRDAVLEIVDPNVLKQVVDEIDSINFTKLGPDEKGDIYEYLLTYLGKIDSKTLGTFRTPRQIRNLMVHLVDPDFGDTICDPACGTGGFIIDSLEYILAKYSGKQELIPIYGEEWLYNKFISKHPEFENNDNIEIPENFINELISENPNLQTYRKGNGDKIPNWDLLENSLYGIDVSKQIMRIASMNLVLHGVPKANIKRANTLSETGGLSDEDKNRKYKVILSNPPFAGALPKDSIREDLPVNSKKSELLFLSVMMKSLAEGGRCAVVVPEGLLFGSTSAHIELRKKLLTEFQLLAIISLPAGVFKPYAGVKTSIIVFRKPIIEIIETQLKAQKIWFYEINNDGFETEKISSGGRIETPNKNDIPILIKEWKEYKMSNFIDVPGIPSETLLNFNDKEIKSWWITIDKIIIQNYNLTANNYKPQKIGAPIIEKPIELTKELINNKIDVLNILQNLLKKLEDLS